MFITIAKTLKMLKPLVILFMKKLIHTERVTNKANPYILIKNTGMIKVAQTHLRTLHESSTRALVQVQHALLHNLGYSKIY